jgi:hypothetical protein
MLGERRSRISTTSRTLPRENPEVYRRRREIAARIVQDLIERGEMEAPDAAD